MRQTAGTTTSKSVTPAKMKAKMPVAVRPETEAKKPTRPPVAATPVKAEAVKSPRQRVSTRRKPEISQEQRRCYVEVAAYFVAERHGFMPGREHDDWVEAEAQIDRMIAEGLLQV